MDLRALIFMPALVGSVVIGFVFLIFICHYYLEVLEGTAGGAKDVPWQPSQIVDNFWKVWYLGFLIGMWLGPAFMIGRAVAGGDPWLRMFVPLAFLWLIYPISQLSSLSASSIWMPLVPDVFARMAQKPLVVLQFLVLSAGVLALFGVAFRWTFMTEGEWELLLVGAPLVVVASLLYARLLGRLAFLLRFTKGLFEPKRRKKVKAESEPEEKPEPAPKPRKRQPRGMAPIETPDGELTGYDMQFEDDPPPVPKKRVKAETVAAESEPEPKPAADSTPDKRPARRRATPQSAVESGRVWADDDDDAAAYGVREAEVKSGDNIPDEVVVPTADEVRLLSRTGVPRKPKRSWGPELLTFLGQPGTVSAVLIASGFCFVLGALVRVARANNPVGGA